MAGDMNFTTSPEEVWGHSTQNDSLAGFFKTLFLKNSLVDLAPMESVPTWKNGRSGHDNIASCEVVHFVQPAEEGGAMGCSEVGWQAKHDRRHCR